MLLASSQQHHSANPAHSSVQRHLGLRTHLGKHGSEAIVGTFLSSVNSSMERSASEYSQSGLPSPYPSNYGDTQSETSSVDHASAAPYASQQEVRSSNYSSSATPTSDYSVYPPSARSGSFPEHVRQYHPATNHSVGSGGMAQTPTSPSSVPLHDGRNHHSSAQPIKSDSDVPIDPSIAASSPTYPHGQYSPAPYAPPPQDMPHGYQHPASSSMYAQPRPDWTGYSQHGGPINPGHHVFPQTPTSAAPQRPNQVYSFVPIPGAQQHKRPRRRYEEIERMYKCGWNGCEKAYGTLNHLNAHVTMQAHGQKRTPEEFKEIRKEWKARKKEEEAQRKAEDERQRQAAASAAAQDGADPATSQPPTTYQSARPVQLPPIGYGSAPYPAAPASAGIQPPMQEYNGGNHVYPGYQPASPYGQPNQTMYNHNAPPPGH
ncbi:putative transcriptional regulator [Diplogelasinospora grovesii]|uniref:Transcriptional regulator n=1 Tax=Diplogelasinospora grovesii TaxID=303347 RepID=A0AAN6N206_9PEZI|nr:putative transcriptional regulator [Diplogelasinospora grovesii]